ATGIRRPARGERGEQGRPHPLAPSPPCGEGERRMRRGGQGMRAQGETLSVARTRALAESAARIALPTALAPGIRDCARIESRWRSVRESRPAADLAGLPPEHAARKRITKGRVDRYMWPRFVRALRGPARHEVRPLRTHQRRARALSPGITLNCGSRRICTGAASCAPTFPEPVS